MTEASLDLEYISVGCNRTPHCVDWNVNGLLAYGADKSIALARETRDGGGPDSVVAMLHGHSDRVNCVCWVTPRSGHAQYTLKHRTAVELVSGSVDKSVIVWVKGKDDTFTQGQVLTGHSGSVTSVAAINYFPCGEDPVINTLIASGSADSAVCIWKRTDPKGQFLLLQTIPFGRGFVMGLDFHELPGVKGQPLLACGGDDTKVHLLTSQQDGQFVRVMSLSGHEDWVRDVSFTQEDTGDLLLASCAQDAYIRLWRVSMETEVATPTSNQELKLTSNIFSTNRGSKFKVTVESVLIGHEDWVYSVQWEPLQMEPTITQPLCLLSASMDKTMLLWKPDPSSGVWVEHVRVGDVGGNTLGLYGGRFSPQGGMIIGHGYQGAFHLWKNSTPFSDVTSTDQSDQPVRATPTTLTDQYEKWVPLPTMSGHFEAVQDIAWDPRGGDFLISVSSDQTSRLHAPWRRGEVGKDEKLIWWEIARPQIHGYDMQCVAMVDSLLYVSGADEKVLRVFKAPQNFVGNQRRISGVNLSQATGDLPMGASVPSLGLSNKAVFDIEESSSVTKQQSAGGGVKSAFGDDLPAFTPIDLQAPPVEAHLLQNTLWPETQKLYGHGYELYCVASSPSGRYIASACKATKPEHAAIRVWSTSSWRQVTTLTLHSLTVTQLAFSHLGHYLLAVSRDRCWSLWKLNDSEDSLEVTMEAHTNKSIRSHTRIIWACSWSHDDQCFTTASRDKKVCLWMRDGCVSGKECGGGWRLGAPPLECESAVTAVDFAPRMTSNSSHILAVGLEDGRITLHTCPTPSHTLSPDNFWSSLLTVSPSHCHTSSIKRLKWRPLPNQVQSEIKLSETTAKEKKGGADSKSTVQTESNEGSVSVKSHVDCDELCLASCSTDHCVKVFSLTNLSLI